MTQTIANVPELVRTSHPSSYVSPGIFAEERRHVFPRTWHPVAHVDQVREPGQFLSVTLGNDPIVIVKDADGVLHALSRVCPHRGFPVVEGCGTTKTFRCPYHRWVFDLDGRLRGAPGMEEAEDFDPSTCNLPRLSLEEWQGFLFVNADPDAPALAPQLSALTEMLDPFGLADMQLVHTQEWDSPWNWKVMVENFMESYHHIGAHKGTLQQMNPGLGTYPLDMQGPFAVLENPAVEGADPFWVINLFPTGLFSVQRSDPPTLVWYQMDIDGPTHLTLQVHLFVPKDVASNGAFTESMAGILRAVHLEDIPMCEGIQQGMASAFAPIDAPRSPLEGCLVGFRHWLADQLETAANA